MEVSALIGPSGTGKSHRAIMVAHLTNSEIIIDDGLIIKGDTILFGHTAKKQPTRIGAIKAALFLDDDLAAKARETIENINPGGVLILGTSLGMVRKIALTLGLPEITRVIDIHDVATPEEIKKARINRTRFSRHVIPAPTMAVRKSFPGTLIDPLMVLMRKEMDSSAVSKSWLEQSVVRPSFTYYGKLTISESAIASIVSLSSSETSGVKSPGKIHVAQTEDGLVIDISPVLYYGIYLPGVCKKIQERVKERLEYMTGLSIKAINILVKDIGLKTDQLAQRKTTG
ncbi:MAG: Asp23/Gls24 family envelope stress response protein [Bacillota bacterium]